MAHGERVASAALAQLPHGRFTLEEEQDSGAVYHVETGDVERLDNLARRDQPPRATPRGRSRASSDSWSSGRVACRMFSSADWRKSR